MYESPINQILGEMQITYENECMKAVQSYGFDVNKEELTKALMYDREQYEKGYAEANEELEFLVSEFLIPLQIENVCDELGEWDIDEDNETWCSRNCGKTNCGKYPEMNCYKEWMNMKRRTKQ